MISPNARDYTVRRHPVVLLAEDDAAMRRLLAIALRHDGFGDTRTHLEAHRLGVSCVLDKPFDLARLRAEALRLAVPLEVAR